MNNNNPKYELLHGNNGERASNHLAAVSHEKQVAGLDGLGRLPTWYTALMPHRSTACVGGRVRLHVLLVKKLLLSTEAQRPWSL